MANDQSEICLLMWPFQGGDGVEREIQFLRPLTVSILSERRTLSPFGMAGGSPGETGRNEVRRGRDGRIIHLCAKDTYNAQAGDSIRILTPGGGGYGSADDDGVDAMSCTMEPTRTVETGSLHQFRRLQESA